MRFIFLAVLPLLAVGSAWAQTTRVDATITIDDAASNAYVLTASEGEGIGEVGTENAAWTLQVGYRYRVVNDGKLVFHPFELRSDETVLLAQTDAGGTFEENADVNFVSDDAGVTFTLTPELAEVLTSYRCAYHLRMTGLITVERGS